MRVTALAAPDDTQEQKGTNAMLHAADQTRPERQHNLHRAEDVLLLGFLQRVPMQEVCNVVHVLL